MKINILFSVRHLLLQDLAYIDTPLFSIDTRSSVRDSVMEKNIKQVIGIKALQSFEKNIFGYKVLPVEHEVKGNLEIGKMLQYGTYSSAEAIKTFLLFLWFIKDNSISIGDAYGYESETSQLICYPNHMIYSDSTGRFESVHFSEAEIDQATKILLKYISICPAKSTDEEAIDFFMNSSNTPDKDIFRSGVTTNNEMNNLQRAVTFLSTARSIPYLPYKISLYMPILESLFSDDANEVTQKVSERVAFYIGKEKDERIDIFKTVKDAYEIRSRFLHGQKLNPKKSKPDYLNPLSIKVDELIRKTLTKIIMEDSNIFLQSNTDFLKTIIFK